MPARSSYDTARRRNGIDLRDFGVLAGDGQDHTTGIQAALDEAASVGGIVTPGVAGILNTSATLEIAFGVVLAGVGANSEIFGHDAQFPNADGTMIRQVSGGADVIRTKNFAVLTGDTSPDTYITASRFGLRDLVIDGGTYVGNTSLVGLKVYGRSYRLNNVVIQNCAGGGLYSEWGAGGYDMEATIDGLHIFNCGGIGLEWRGPHDSQFSNVIVGQAAAGATYGIRLVRGSQVGGEGFTNAHAWGTYSQAVWDIGTSNGTFYSCVSDGGGVRFTGSGNVWNGQIYGTQTPGQAAVTFGDGSAVMAVDRNQILGQIWNFKGSPLAVIAPSATSTGNVFRAVAKMGGAIRYGAKNFQTTLTSAASSGATTLNVGSTTGWPTSSSAVYADDGTTRVVSIAYTGKTATTLTGVSGVTSSLASGAGVWVEATFFGTDNLGADSFDVLDHDHPTNGVLFRQGGTVASDTNHTAMRIFSSGVTALEGFVLAREGVTGPRIWGGSGAPSFSATAGDYFFRSDTPSTSNQRLYVCTGGSSWTGIL